MSGIPHHLSFRAPDGCMRCVPRSEQRVSYVYVSAAEATGN